MPLQTWSRSYTVGVRAMDEQHGILMDGLHELRLAAVRGSGREQMSEDLDRLIRLFLLHFYNEESLMASAGYPHLAVHHAAHLRLAKLLRESLHHARYGVNVQMTPLLSSLRDGYLEHMEGPDQGYGPWLNARGVE